MLRSSSLLSCAVSVPPVNMRPATEGLCSNRVLGFSSLYKVSSSNNFQNAAKFYSQKLDSMYSEDEKTKIMKIINDAEEETLSRYALTKGRLRKIMKWKESNGALKQLSDIEIIDGFSERITTKFFDSVINDGAEMKKREEPLKIRGQILSPPLTEAVKKNTNKVLAVYVTIHSVSWSGIQQEQYELSEWGCHSIEVPEGKKLQIADIMDISWSVLSKLPEADLYIMEAPPTTLRASGNDPNNPKVMTINLQRAQIIAMLVALINARKHTVEGNTVQPQSTEGVKEQSCNQAVYFLRPTLASRLYRTLIGNERVSAEHAVATIFQQSNSQPKASTNVSVSETMQTYFNAQRDIQKEVLGQCLLLALTFMEVCFYKNTGSIAKLAKQGTD